MDEQNVNENVAAEAVQPSETQNQPVKRTRFYGSYDHSLDGKGRIIIPTAYRAPLGQKFTISLTRDCKAIAFYPNDVFEAFASWIESLNQTKPAVQKLRNIVYKMTFPDAEADAQGRILLPAKIRQAILKNADSVEISGDGDHVRIMDSKIGAAEDLDFFEHREQIMEEIAELDEQ